MDTNSLLTDPEIRNLLHQRIPAGDIAAEVADEALKQSDIPSFFNDLAQHGCTSGMVGKLIYYSDTADFFDRHYDEIEELREEWEDSTGAPLTIIGDLKNFYAWFSFETVAYEIARELGFS